LTGASTAPGGGPASTAPGGGPASTALFERAQRVIPGGVNSPVRAFHSVGGSPFFVTRAAGAHLWDEDGRRYVDWVQSYGATILGHAHPAVVEAVAAAAAAGTTYGAPTRREVELAETVAERVPGCEMVRLVSSGTEAAMSVLRLARGATGRTRVVKFSGNYHGHSDALLAAAGTGLASLSLPDSAGVAPGAVADTSVVPYNRVPELDRDVACVIVEPVAANMGLVPPAPGFLEGLRAECDRVGALLVFDEVITGFRLGPGGASVRYGVTPDLWCFGKVIGGGLPLAAFAGRRDLMEVLAPLGPVYQAGTLSGNPVATAAGLAVLGRLDAAAYDQIEATAAALQEALVAAFAAAGRPASVPRVGTLVGIFLAAGEVRDYDSARAAAGNGLYPGFFHALLGRGVSVAPGAYEVLFPGLAHGPEEVEATAEAVVEAARAASAR
jgi:glutamate-1-semialdehyde 2,1-aminomutase